KRWSFLALRAVGVARPLHPSESFRQRQPERRRFVKIEFTRRPHAQDGERWALQDWHVDADRAALVKPNLGKADQMKWSEPASRAISVGRAPTRRCIWSRVRPTISSVSSLPGTIRVTGSPR